MAEMARTGVRLDSDLLAELERHFKAYGEYTTTGQMVDSAVRAFLTDHHLEELLKTHGYGKPPTDALHDAAVVASIDP